MSTEIESQKDLPNSSLVLMIPSYLKDSLFTKCAETGMPAAELVATLIEGLGKLEFPEGLSKDEAKDHILSLFPTNTSE